MIDRSLFLHKIHRYFGISPICAILGPRQAGKTSLALAYAEKFQVPVAQIFDLENPRQAQALRDNPMLCLENLEGLVILDEIQCVKELFPVLRYLVDRHNKSYLILGSASRDLLNQSSESLAGRIIYMELTPLSLREIPHPESCIQAHMLRGGYPKAYLSTSFEDAHIWLENYIHTFMEIDLYRMGIAINPAHMRQIWVAIAHYHGQLINFQDLSTQIGVSHTTVKNYIALLAGTFMIRVLQPFHENLLKRQVKSPKVYIRDSGIAMHLLDMTEKSYMWHPKIGALWEGYAMEEVIRFFEMREDFCYFWRTADGAELDLFFTHKGLRLGFEFKYADCPSISRSMSIAIEDLKLDKLYVITPKGFWTPMKDKIISAGIYEFLESYERKVEE